MVAEKGPRGKEDGAAHDRSLKAAAWDYENATAFHRVVSDPLKG